MALSKAIRWVVRACFVVCVVFLTVNSFLFTCRINPRETTDYLTDAPWTHIAALAALLGLCAFLYRRGTRMGPRAWKRLTLATAAVMLVGLVSCVLVSRSIPVFDQAVCASAAYSTSIGAYFHYLDGQYLSYFPYQIPFVLFCVPFSLLTGADNVLILQLVNVAAILVMVCALAKIAALLTKEPRMEALCWLGCFFFFPLWFYATFVYGTIVGGAFMLAGARQLLLYLNDRKKRRMVWMGLLFTLACLMKMNYLIAVIAAGILLIADSLETRRVFSALAALCVAFLCLTAKTPIVRYMEGRTGQDLSQGFPLSTYIMLGLQEGDRSPGWYNENGYNLYRQTDGDRAETEKLVQAAIRERLNDFAKDPAYALSFFYRKTVSQWNEPSFQSLWNNEMMRNPERSPLVLSLYERGKVGKAMLRWMDEYHWLLCAGLCLWLVFRMKKASLAELFLPLFLVGGFLCHLVWEGKSQYVMIYVFCVIPYAVTGYLDTTRWLMKKASAGKARAGRGKVARSAS